MNKKAGLNQNIINTTLIAIVLLVVMFQAYATIMPTAQTAGDSLGDSARCTAAGGFYNASQSACLNGTNPADTLGVTYAAIPLSTIFSGTGIVFLIVMAALVILVVRSFMKTK